MSRCLNFMIFKYILLPLRGGLLREIGRFTGRMDRLMREVEIKGYIIFQKMQKNYKFKYQSSKRSQQAITRFAYYAEEIIPPLFSAEKSTPTLIDDLRFAAGPNSVLYFHSRKLLQGEQLVNEASILRAIKATHLEPPTNSGEVHRINDQSFGKKTTLQVSFLPISKEANEVLEFVLEKKQGSAQGKEFYQLYIIHHCHTDQNGKSLKWLHFVQKYLFRPSLIEYEVIAACLKDTSYFNLQSNQSLFQTFIRSHFQFQKLQGNLLQYQDRIKEEIKVNGDPAFSEEHNLSRKIPPQFLKSLHALRKEFGDHNEKEICRFYIGKDFNLQETRKNIAEYLKWKQEISKYKWEDFEEFHQMGIFHYLGEDHLGQPVILNIAKNVRVDEMDHDKYCIYYMYYLEVFLTTKMRGHVTQVTIITDLDGIGTSNFKLAVTRKNIQDGSIYCVERQYKFFAVKVNLFAYYCWKFIKPMLPKKTVEKIFIGGNDLKEITSSLLDEMPIETIPSYLGGSNPII